MSYGVLYYTRICIKNGWMFIIKRTKNDTKVKRQSIYIHKISSIILQELLKKPQKALELTLVHRLPIKVQIP